MKSIVPQNTEISVEKRDALDIIEKKLFELKVERNQANWKNDWRPAFIKMHHIHAYLLSHMR